MHEKEVEIAGVVDEESLVSGGHHVTGLLVAAVADLYVAWKSACHCHIYPYLPFALPFDVCQDISTLVAPGILQRTLGIAAWPLNLLLTLLSIPFGFLQLGATHMKRSLWWRLNRLACFLTIATCFFAATILTDFLVGL